MFNKFFVRTKCKGGPNLLIKPMHVEELAAEILDGWVSKRYGIRERNSILRYSVESECPIQFEIELRTT